MSPLDPRTALLEATRSSARAAEITCRRANQLPHIDADIVREVAYTDAIARHGAALARRVVGITHRMVDEAVAGGRQAGREEAARDG